MTDPIKVKRITRICQLPWKPVGRILDPFAGEKKWWLGSDIIPIFSDLNPQRLDVIQADAAHLPFPDHNFDQVWADPPHIIKQGFGKSNPMYIRFGTYKTRTDCNEKWTAWAKEFARLSPWLCLKTIDGGNPIWCVTAADLQPFHNIWHLEETVRTKTSPGWSKAFTLYTRWSRRANP